MRKNRGGGCFAVLLVILMFNLVLPAHASDASEVGGKSGNVVYAYLAAAILSLLFVAFYFFIEKKRERKFMLLYSCVAIADIGYFLLSISGSLQFALFANRVAYFGSAYSVLMMLLIIIDVSHVQCARPAKAAFVAVCTAAFLLASTGGWLDIYYASVSLEVINGATKLVKVYAPLHILYPIYVVSFFITMVCFIVYAKLKGRIMSTKYAVFLAAIVLGNIAVWGVEQIIDVDFEFLSISYIATEVLLLIMSVILREYDEMRSREASLLASSANETEEAAELPPNIEELFQSFSSRVATLTPTERMVLQYYIEGCSIEEVASRAYISINTAKKHNTNLNRKLELRSREELSLYIDLFRRANRLDEIAYMR